MLMRDIATYLKVHGFNAAVRSDVVYVETQESLTKLLFELRDTFDFNLVELDHGYLTLLGRTFEYYFMKPFIIIRLP